MDTMLSTAQISAHAMSCCYCWLYPWIPCCPLHKYQHMPCLVAIVDCTHGYHVVHCTNISTCHVLLLLLTVPMDTMLSTAQISAHAMSCCYCWLYPWIPCCPLHKYQHMPCLVAIVDCTHGYHVVHCTNISTCHVLLLLLTVPMDTTLSTAQISAHAMSCCYCWLYPWIPCCPLHKYQHMPCLVDIVDCTHGYHVVHCTNISTCHVLLLLLTVPMDTMLSTVQISAHAMSCCYCWLYPWIPCCPLHKYQHMPCLVAIVDCTHGYHVVHCTNISTCHVLLLLLTVPMDTMLSTAQISAHAMSCCYCWLYPWIPCCPLHKYQHMPCLVAIVDCTHGYHVVHCTNISTCHVSLLLLTVPMDTMLSTVQISAHAMSCCYCWLYPWIPCCPLYKYQHMPCLVAIVDCTHGYHVVHCTNISTCHVLLLLLTVPMDTMLSTAQISAHAMSCCYCRLHPWIPCCPLHKYQHMPCLVAIVDCTHGYHVVHCTNISTCHVLLLLLTVPMDTMLFTAQISAHDVLLLLLTVPMDTMLSTVQISAHAMSCCYCWLYPWIPCCPLYKYQHMPCLVAIVDCTHGYHVVHCTNISTCHVLLLLLTVPMDTMLSTAQISAHAMSCCYCWLYPWIPCCPLYKYQHMPCLVAIVDCTHGYHVVHCTNISTCHVLLLLFCTHVGSVAASFRDLITVT